MSLFVNVLREWLCCGLQVNYIVYKHFDKSLHIKSLDPTCVQIVRHAYLTVFEILGFKLKNENDKKKNCRSRLFAIVYPKFVAQFLGRHIYIY